MSLLQQVRRRALGVYLVVAVMAAGGVYELTRLPWSIFPSVTFPMVKVIANTGEQPAAQMIPTVTRPLEEAILRVPGVEGVLSTTSRGSTELSARFHWRTDMQVALQRTEAETRRVLPRLPSSTRIDTEWMNTAIYPILGYALTSETRSLAELYDLAEYRLKPALIRIPGISQVQIQGGRKREFQVQLDPQALAARLLTPAAVAAALRDDNLVLSAGLIEQNHELYLALVSGRVKTTEALADLAVPLPKGGPPARLSELGRVVVEDAVSYVRTTAQGQPAVLLNVIRQPSVNVVTVAQEIERLLRERADLISSDTRWTNFYDQAAFVTDSISGAYHAIGIGVGLAGLILLLFLRSFRLTVVAVVTIPLVVAMSVLGLAAAGQTINLMTLAGVAASLGLVADDAIVVLEKIHSHREAGTADPSLTGLAEVWPALVGSSLSTTAIFIPFAFLNGVVGAFFKPLAFTMAVVLMVSLLVAGLVVPISVRFPLAKPILDSRGARIWETVAARLDRTFFRTVRWFVRHGWVGLLMSLALVAAAYGIYRALGTDFLPSMDEGTIVLDYRAPPGTSLTDTDAMLRPIDGLILGTEGVEGYSRRTGTQLGFFITEPNQGDYVIKLKGRRQRRPVGEIVDELRERIGQIEPAIHTDFGQLIEDNIGDLTGGSPQPVDVRIFGSDLSLLQQKAHEAATIINQVRGVRDLFNGITVAGPSLEIRVRPLAAARFGLSVVDIHALVQPDVAGTVVSQVRLGDRLYDVRTLVAHGGERPMGEFPVITGSGAPLRLSDVAEISTGPPEIEIDRENLRSYLGVKARLAHRNLGAAICEIQDRLRQALPLAAGMSIEYGGLYQQQQESFRELLYVLLAGLALVGVIVAFVLRDWRAPLLTAVMSLATMAGSLLLLRMTGMTLNVSSYVGLIMMAGIAGENAIFVMHDARLEMHRQRPPAEAWALASRRRLRPVVMTVLAGATALSPLALAFGGGAQLMQPLAIAVIGGFLISGPAVLLLLPSLYSLLDPRGRLGR